MMEMIYRRSFRGVYTMQESNLLPSQSLPDPVHLHRTHPARIATVGEHKLVVHDRLDFLAKQHARRVDGHGLVPNNSAVAPVRHQASSVVCEAA